MAGCAVTVKVSSHFLRVSELISKKWYVCSDAQIFCLFLKYFIGAKKITSTLGAAKKMVSPLFIPKLFWSFWNWKQHKVNFLYPFYTHSSFLQLKKNSSYFFPWNICQKLYLEWRKTNPILGTYSAVNLNV